MKWQIWFVPTDRGREFGWKEQPHEGVYADKEEADLARHLEWCDDPAPDKSDYYSLELRPVEDEA